MTWLSRPSGSFSIVCQTFWNFSIFTFFCLPWKNCKIWPRAVFAWKNKTFAILCLPWKKWVFCHCCWERVKKVLKPWGCNFGSYRCVNLPLHSVVGCNEKLIIKKNHKNLKNWATVMILASKFLESKDLTTCKVRLCISWFSNFGLEYLLKARDYNRCYK